MQHLVGRDPHTCGQAGSRWTWATIRAACPWLQGRSLPGVQRVLRRLRVRWKRARSYVHSPDPDYAAKRAAIAAVQAAVASSSGRARRLFLDEVTIERQPSVAHADAPTGHAQGRACRSHAANTLTRIVATLDQQTGQVVSRRASHITVPILVAFYQQLCTTYPDAHRRYVVRDNWPVHTHPDLLVALAPQETPFPFYRPANWPTTPSAKAQRQWGTLHVPIQLVPLPTYASWCNPIEKLWRKLRQEATHLHPWAGDLPQLRAALDQFLDQFAQGSDALRRYVGVDTGFNCSCS